MNNAEKHKCENCIWGDQCGGNASRCDDYYPADTDMAMDYEAELLLEYDRSIYSGKEDEYDRI